MDKQTINTILNLGLNEIKECLKTMSKTLSPMDKYYIIEDDLDDLIQSPLEYIEDIVGYADELKDEVIKDLSPLQIAISKLYLEIQRTKTCSSLSLRLLFLSTETS
jgi:hypothetical protein